MIPPGGHKPAGLFRGLFMKIVDWLLRREAKSAPPMTLADDGAWTIFGGSGPAASGVTIGPGSALTVPAVRGAIGLIAESCASVAWTVHRRVGTDRAVADDHPLSKLIRDGANSFTSWPEFMSGLVADMLRYGRGYALATRGDDGRLLELLRLPAGTVSREQVTPLEEPSYRVTLKGGGQLVLRRAEVLEISCLDGRSPVTDGKEAISLSASLERHAAKLMGKGARPSAVLERTSPNGPMGAGPRNPEEAKQNGDRFASVYGGVSESGSVLSLPVGATFKAITFSSVDLQFAEMRKFQVEEIARIFRVPPTLLQHLDKASLNNTYELASQFGKFCLGFYVTTIEAALRITCLTAEERDELIIEGDMSELMKADMLARFEAYSSGIQSGVLAPNEPRQWENLLPKDGGDEILRPMNMDAAGAAPKKDPAK